MKAACPRCGVTLRQSKYKCCAVCRKRMRRASVIEPAEIVTMLKEWYDGYSVTTLAQRYRVSTDVVRSTIGSNSKPRFLAFLGPTHTGGTP